MGEAVTARQGDEVEISIQDEEEIAVVDIPKQVQEFMPGKMGWVATATREGVPNVTPKGTVQVLDDQHIIFADLFSLKTRQNLEQNPQVAVTVVDPATAKGY